MTEVEVVTRKWGNSLGIALPKKLVEQERLCEHEHLVIEVRRVVDLRWLRGILTTKKSAQQLKDAMRQAWE